MTDLKDFDAAGRLLGAAEHQRETTKYARRPPLIRSSCQRWWRSRPLLGKSCSNRPSPKAGAWTWKERSPMPVGAAVAGAGPPRAGKASPHRSDGSPIWWAST